MGLNIFKRHAEKVGRRLERRITELEEELDTVRSRMDVDAELVEKYFADKLSPDYAAAFEAPEPLITVCIATYNRADLLVERSIPSILNQTYRNLELIVVGDCCTDATSEKIKKFNDDRLRFINLAERGRYPSSPELRWMVAGSTPMNHGLELARGQFITHLDDDDEHMPDRLEKLLACALRERAELVWHPFHYEAPNGEWLVQEGDAFARTKVSTSSVFYHNWFRQIPWDLQAWRMREPGDWNRFRKFKYLNAKCVRYPEPLLRHYRERTQRA
jgi:glycosyltransferase involved in cell wall biosynthesis